MRKILFVLVVLSMLLAACAPAAAPAVAPAATTAPAAAPAATSAGPATTGNSAIKPTGFGDVLKGVLARGKLKCGINPSNPGFSVIDPNGNASGLDIDMCRAVAAAVLGDPKLVEFVPTTGDTRFTMLQTGDIDVLIRSTTWTFTRDTDLGLNFAPPYFYDGQGIMVKKSSGFTKLEDLNGASICMGRGATTELNMADAMAAKNLKYTAQLFDNPDDVISTFEQGRCDAMSNDKSGLIAQRSMTKSPNDYVILDITLSKEPLAPVVRQGDDQWFDIIRWVEYGLWTADEKGITQANVDDIKAKTQDGDIQRMLGVNGELGAKLGLKNDWVVTMIKSVGNFDEIWQRNLGQNTATYIPRGINSEWTNGGLLYAMPFR
jgi:general L-amino acid transport system substrate-binding protein